MPDALHARRAVDHGGLVQLAADAGHGGQIDDGTPAHALPHADEQVGGGPVPFLRKEGDALLYEAPVHHQHIDDARGRLEQLIRHRTDDDPGKKVRQIQNGLRDLFEMGEAQLIEHQRQYNRHGEAHGQIQQVEYDGVFERPQEILVPEDLRERLPAHPFAARVTFGRLVVHEDHPQTGVSGVVEQHNERDGNQQEKVQMPVPPERFFPGS